MALKTKLRMQNMDLSNKRVLIRVDYNVPLNKKKEIQDSRRISATIPTIKLAFEKGAKSVVLVSHLGRPAGEFKPELSLKPIIAALQDNLKEVTTEKVLFIASFDSDEYKKASNPNEKLPPKTVFLLENIRFQPAETGKNGASKEETTKLSENLSRLGDVFVQDAFATSHRSHTSVVGISLKQRGAGLLLAKELDYFSKVLKAPKKPFLSILGGAKVSDKIKLIESLLEKVDEMIIGGGMAYTFLKVLKGTKIGDSLFDKAGSEIVEKIMEKAKAKGVKIHLPVDFVVADDFSPNANTKSANIEDGIPEGWMGLDCGEKSKEMFASVVNRANTIVWNGPLGVFEFEKFSHGTNAVLKALAERTSSSQDVTSIIGGGDTASAAEQLGVSEKMSHVSTGGGASLELLEGKVLPGLEALSDA